MSQGSSLMLAVEEYFRWVLIPHCGFKHRGPMMVDLSSTRLFFWAYREMGDSEHQITVTLTLRSFKEALVVGRFEVEANRWPDGINRPPLILPPEVFLRHFGKTLAPPSKKAWVIACPANLDAMLEEYNRLGAKAGAVVVFGPKI